MPAFKAGSVEALFLAFAGTELKGYCAGKGACRAAGADALGTGALAEAAPVMLTLAVDGLALGAGL